MSTLRAALAAAAARLADAGVTEPAGDARRLLAGALGIEAGRLTPMADEPLGEGPGRVFARYVAARAARRPVAQILGRRAFWGREFEVTRDVLDPRPETETLVAAALAGPPAARVLDLGVGSGAILVSLLAEWPAARGLGTDVSAAALTVAARNAARHGVSGRAEFALADWLEGVAGRFDLIVANPPYIPAAEVAALAREVRDWEPRGALTPGPSGLEAYHRIAAGLGAALAPGGRALFEIGTGQGAAVAAILREAGLGRVGFGRDLDGRERVISVVAGGAE